MSVLKRPLLLAAGCVAASLVVVSQAQTPPNTGEPQILSTGQTITPLAPKGASFQPLNPGLADNPSYTVGQAVTTTLSPDGKTLLVLTSGYNVFNYTSGTQAGKANPTDSTEWVFVFDVSNNNKPVQKQTIPVPNTYNGVAWSPTGLEFFVSGGNNDNVHIYSQVNSAWTEQANSPVALGHTPTSAIGSAGGLGLATQPEAAGLAVSSDGNAVVVANYENDSITELVKTPTGWIRYLDYDLRPGKQSTAFVGIAGGEYPFWVQGKGSGTAYISSVRDRQIVVLNGLGVQTRISVPGQPNKMLMNKAQSLLYVAQDNAPGIAVIDTNNNVVIDEIQPPTLISTNGGTNNFLGANPNSLALSPDEKTLYVTEGGLNAVAVYRLSAPGESSFAGFIPTGFYPNSVSVSADGKMLYIANGKSATGPNPQYCDDSQSSVCDATNTYIWQITKAGFQTVPVPSSNELANLTQKVFTNDHIGKPLTANEQDVVSFLHNHIQHIIYIIKENRTYDQVLGDLEVGNGDPTITQFPQTNTPNFHNMARNFVDFDNFFDVSDVSGDGWPWSTSARSTDVIEKEIPVNYAGRGLDNDSEGTNRNLNVGIASIPARYAADPLTGLDADLLPGNANVAAPDGEDGSQGQGYLWNGALKAGLTVRDHGFFLDIVRYNLTAAPFLSIPEDPNPYADKLQVAYSTNTVLSQYTDPYFRGFDNSFPDYFRFTEWQREFNQYVAGGNLPNLSLVRLMHDHFGNFSTAINGVNTPELQIADNDYAVAALIQAVANSPYKSNTLIFVIEDDAQDGGDHVDAHRSTAFIVGPYVKKTYVDSTRYNTVNFLATMEDILGIPPLNINDANAAPMTNAFNIRGNGTWTFTATPSPYLAQTTLPIPGLNAPAIAAAVRPLHDAEWWAAHTKGMDFSVEDHLDSAKFNRVVWQGVKGNRPYPYFRTGKDLSNNRSVLLAKYHAGKLGMDKPTEVQREKAALEAQASASHRDHDDDDR